MPATARASMAAIVFAATVALSFAEPVPTIGRVKYAATPVVYSHNVLDARHASVGAADALVGAFAKQLMDNIGPHGLRRLAAGDFDELNALFKGTVLVLPDADFTIDTSWWLPDVDISMRNLRCTNLRLDDMTVGSQRVSAKFVDFSVAITGLAIDCTVDWAYDAGIRGSGSASARSSGNSIRTVARFHSEDFDRHAPHKSTIEKCDSTMSIDSMDFSGGISASILNLFESAVKGKVEEEVSDMACKELSGLGSDTLSAALKNMSSFIDPYLPGGAKATPSDPLAFQASVAARYPADQLVDLSGLRNSSHPAGQLIGWGLEEMTAFFGQQKDDPTGPNAATTGTDLGVNVVARSSLLDKNGAYTFDMADLPLGDDAGVLYKGHDMLTETSISVTAVRVLGLDSFTKFDPIQAIGAQTLKGHVVMKKLEVEADLTIDMRPSTHSTSVIVNPSTPRQVEHITIKTGLDTIDLQAAVLLAIDGKALDAIQLGSLLHTDQLLPCALSALAAFNVSQLKLSVGDIEPPVLTGFISKGIDRVLSGSAIAAFHMYEAVIKQALPGFFDSFVRSAANDFARDYLANATHTTCPDPTTTTSPPTVPGSLLSFPALFGANATRYGDLLATAHRLVDEWLLSPVNTTTGRAAVNDLLIVPWTEAQSEEAGTWRREGDLFDVAANVSLGTLKRVELRVSNARLEHLDSISTPPLYLLRPRNSSEPHHLDSAAAVGNAPRPLRAAARVLIALKGDSVDLRNEVDLTFEVEAVRAFLSLLLKVDEGRFLGMRLGDAFRSDCWLATVAQGDTTDGVAMAISNAALSLARAALGVTCVDCSGPLFVELAARLSSSAATDEIRSLAASAMAFAEGALTGEEAQARIAHALENAQQRCDDPSLEAATYAAPAASFDPGVGDTSLAFGAGAVALAFLCVFLCVYSSHQRRAARREKLLTDEERDAAADAKRRQRERREAVGRRTRAIALSADTVPLLVRVCMPLVVIGNIALFLSGHLDLGATVDLEIGLGGQKATVEQFFEFSMAKSTVDMWNAGAKELAILIVIFSGIWPYTKQLTVLFLWFAPPSLVSLERRGSIFSWLDSLGKWSMIDIFVLVLSLVAFRVSVKSPSNLAALPPGFWAAELMVVPLWGLYANLIAQLVSQISSHFIIYYHRNICAAAEQDQRRSELRAATLDMAAHGNSGDCASPGPGGAAAALAAAAALSPSADEVAAGDASDQWLAAHRPRRASTWVDMSGFEASAAPTADMAMVAVSRLAVKDQVFRIGPQQSSALSAWAGLGGEQPHHPEHKKTTGSGPTTAGGSGAGVRRYRLRGGASVCVFACAAVAVGLLCWGCAVPSFRLTIWGLLGHAVEVGEKGGSSQSYGVFSTAAAILAQADHMGQTNSHMGLGLLTAVFIGCVFIVPILQTIALLWLWNRPMTLQSQKRAFILAEALAAWQYMEVYLIAIMLAVFQLGQISGFMVNEYCDPLAPSFAGMVRLGVLDPHDAQCFYVHATIESGAYLLLAAAVALAVLTQLVMAAAAAAIEDREHHCVVLALAAAGRHPEASAAPAPEPTQSPCFRWLLVLQPPLAFSAALHRRGWVTHDGTRVPGSDGDGSDIEAGRVGGDDPLWEVLEEGAPTRKAGSGKSKKNGGGGDRRSWYFHTKTGQLLRAPPCRKSKQRKKKKRRSSQVAPASSGAAGDNAAGSVEMRPSRPSLESGIVPDGGGSSPAHRSSAAAAGNGVGGSQRQQQGVHRTPPPPLPPRPPRAAPPRIKLPPRPSGARSSQEPQRRSAGPCRTYVVDMTARGYNMCRCGHPKNAHSDAARY